MFRNQQKQFLRPNKNIFRFLDPNQKKKKKIFLNSPTQKKKKNILRFLNPSKKKKKNFWIPPIETRPLFSSRAKPTRHFHDQIIDVVFIWLIVSSAKRRSGK